MACKAPITSTGAFRAKLDKLLKGLRAKTAKDRAAARKYALDLLSQPNGSFARFLSWGGGPGMSSLWHKIVDHTLIMIEFEVEHNKKRSKYRSPATDLSSFLLRIIRLSDDNGRQSLHSLVRTLLRHIVEHLSDENSQRVFGADYTQIVIHLFEIPQYCELIESHEFEEDPFQYFYPKITRLVMRQIIESTTASSTNRSDIIMWATTLASVLCNYCGDMYSIFLPIAIFVEGLVKDVDFSQKGLGTGAMCLVLKAYLSVVQRLGTSCADILRIHGSEIIHSITRCFRDAPRKDREVMLAYLNTHLHIAWTSTRRFGLTQKNSDPILSAISTLREMFFSAEEIDAATLTGVGGVATSYQQLTDQGRLHLKLCKQIVLISHEIAEGMLFSERKGRAAAAKRICRETPWEEVKRLALSIGRSPSEICVRLTFLRVLRGVLTSDGVDWSRQKLLLKCHEISIVLQGLNDLLLLDLDQHSQAWVLDCLLHTAVVSSAFRTGDSNEELLNSASPSLEPIWTCIWHTLLRSDLPFVSLTSRSLGDKDVDGEGITVGDFVMDILAELLRLQLVAKGAVEKSQDYLWKLPAFRCKSNDMSYRVLNVISGYLLSYSLHNGPDVIMEGGKEMANTRRGRLLQLVMNWLHSRLGMTVSIRSIHCFSNALVCILCVDPDQSILHPVLYELPGSDILFSGSASNTHPSYLASNSISFTAWRVAHFRDNGTLNVHHDFVLKHGLGWFEYVQRELTIDDPYLEYMYACKCAAQRIVVSSERLLHKEIMADFGKALECMETRVRTMDNPQATLLAHATIAKAFCDIADKSLKLEQVATDAVNRFTTASKSFYSAGNYESLINALSVVKALRSTKDVVIGLQEFCACIVKQWVAGENMPIPAAAQHALASTSHPGCHSREMYDDFMDYNSEDELGIVQACNNDTELNQQRIFSFISRCVHTAIGASWPISLCLLESIRSFVMVSYEKDLVDGDTLIEIANSLAIPSQHTHCSAEVLDTVGDILEKALYCIRGKGCKVSYVWLLRWLTAFGRSIRQLPQFSPECKVVSYASEAAAGEQQKAKMLKCVLCRFGKMLHIDLLGMEEVQAARVGSAIIRETVLWCTMIIFTCCPAANQNWFTQEVLERCIKDEDDAVRLRGVRAIEMLIMRHSPSKHLMIYTELMQILTPLESEKSITRPSHSSYDRITMDHATNLMDTIESSKNHRHLPSNRKECELTTLQIMCGVASISKSVRCTVLFDLCKCSIKPDLCPLVPPLIATIAKRCSISDGKTLLLSHVDYIVYNWLCPNELYSLENFPYELFGFESMRACVHFLGGVMVPLAFLSGRNRIIKQVTAMFPGYQVKQVLKLFWPNQLAFLALLRFIAPELYKKARGSIQMYISPRDMGLENSEEQLQCVLQIVALSVADPFGPFKCMDHNAVHAALEEVSWLSKSSPNNAIGLLTRLNFLDIILNARIHVLADPLNERTMSVVQLLVNLMDWTQQASIQSLTGTVEVLLSVLEMQVKTKGTWPKPSSVTILGQLCERVSQNEAHKEILANRHLKPIIQGLWSAIDLDWTTSCKQPKETHKISSSESGREEIELLLEKLLLDTDAFTGLIAPEDICVGINVCRPRLLEWYKSSTECYSPIQRLKTAVAQLTQKAFARRGALYNVCACVTHVRDVLASVRAEKIQDEQVNHYSIGRNCSYGGFGEFSFTIGSHHRGQWEKEVCGTTVNEELTGILNAIAGAAVALCQSQDDPSGDVRKSALQLLGDIGPLPENDSRIFGEDFATTVNTTSCKDEMVEPRPVQWTEILYIPSLKLKALELLCLYLLDPDKVTSMCALATMRTLCATVGQEVLNMVNHKAYLADMIGPFVSNVSDSEVKGRQDIKGSHISRIEGGRVITVQEAFSDSVWTFKGRTYDQWVCSVAPTLLALCAPTGGGNATTLECDAAIINGSDSFLSSFSNLCKMKSELAEYLFPAAVYELIASGERMQPNPSEVALSQVFKRYLIKPPGDRWLVKATRLGLIALNLLRQYQVSRFVQLTRGPHQNVASSSNAIPGSIMFLEDDRLAFEGAPDNNGCSGGGLPFGFYLDLDFKDVAMAAMRCGAWRSALLYAEFWFEHDQQTKKEGGGVVVTLSPGEREFPVGGLKLLTDILLGLGDTHDIQGCRANHLSTTRALSMASAYAHQGEWRWALPALDAFTGAWEGQIDDTTHRVLQTGIATALMQMGLPHVLETYLLGLRASSSYSPYNYSLPDLNGSLGEFEQETHWRNCGQVEILHHHMPSPQGSIGGSYVPSNPADAARAPVDDFSDLLKVVSSVCKTSEGFHAHLNEALSALKMSNLNKLEDSIKLARDGAMQGITEELNLEGGKQLSYIMVELQAMVELEEAAKSAVLNQSCCPNLVKLHDIWTGRLNCTLLQERYQLLEPIALLREVILRTMVMLSSQSSKEDSGEGGGGSTASTNCATNILFNHLLMVADIASISGHLSQASGAIIRARRLCTQEKLYNLDLCSFAEARVAWARGDSDGAINLAKSVVAHYNSSTSFSTTALGPNLGDIRNGKECNRSNTGVFVQALTTVGEWMAKTRSESSQDILDNYMRRAVAVSDFKRLPLQLRCSAHLTLARYVSGLHTRVRDRVRSAEWQLGNRVAESRKSQLLLAQKHVEAFRHQFQVRDACTEQYDAMKRHAVVLEREVRMDEEERRGVEDSVEAFLLEALHEYEIALRMSIGPDVHDMFRVMSLCFAATQFTSDKPRIADAMLNLVHSVPSYKFVPLAYQISSRIGSGGNDSTSRMVGALVRRLCKDHPYHLLPKIFALANGNSINSGSQDAEQYKRNIVLSGGRITAAAQILSELYYSEGSTVKEASSTVRTVLLSDIIYSIDTVCRAYLDLAMASTAKPSGIHKKKVIYISDILPKGGISIVNCGSSSSSTHGVGGPRKHGHYLKRSGSGIKFPIPAPVITHLPPLQPDGDYSKSILTISSIASTIELTDTGIHTPKIVRCTASDGRTYRQLVKAGDDLRQDAVMQQVFLAVNGYLSESGELYSQHGAMRTYNIVPLSPDTGVIEWVDNTMPFGSYLVDRAGKKGAHSRYFPTDISCREARELMKKAMTFKAKLQAWKKVESHFHPVFRFFFMEHFPDPCTWHRRRQQYTRSVATASMVGYVLGIGDRHCQNILIDVGTGEVVHIDFGVTFEQGKALSTPETVPFRLTRDVVDGMGVLGTEGTFRHSCEVTLQVLRDNAASLNTILEVFVHDPLFRWMLSPIDARQRQCADKDDENGIDPSVQMVHASEAAVHAGQPGGVLGRTSPPASSLSGVANGTTGSKSRADVDSAERALIRVRQKLQGYEDPNGEAMAVEGQVKLLINEAQSPENLSCLYPGWAPWV